MTQGPLVALLTNNDDDVYCFRLELIRALLRERYRLLISCPDGPKFEAMEQAGLRKGVDFIYDDPPIDRRGADIRRDARLILHYRRLFVRHRPDVILTYTAKPNVYSAFAAAGLRIPVIRNVTGLGSVIHERGVRRGLIMALFKAAYTRSACIMLQNQSNMELARKLGWVRGDCRLIPGSGVALDRFPAQPYPPGGDGRSGEPVVFNYIGRVLHDKGVDDYIEAAGRVRAEYPRTEFNILGFIEPTESRYEALLRQKEEQGILFYRGAQKDVLPWIRRSHATVHPSTYGEGMSNVLLESAACARPLITTDNPGCRETVDAGRSGMIYPGGDVDALVDALRAFLKMSNGDRRDMGLLGRGKMELEFDRTLVTEEYLKTIQAIIEDNRRKPNGSV